MFAERNILYPTKQYGALLRGWSSRAAQFGVQSDVPFGGGNSRYCPPAQAAKDALQASPSNWIITDAGVDAECEARLASLVLTPPAALSLPPIEMEPAFNTNLLTYTATTVDLDMVTVTATPINPDAALRYQFDGDGFLPQADFVTYDLDSGEHIIDIEIISQDGIDRDMLIYTIILTVTYSPTDIALTSIGATTPLADDGINENTEVNTEVGVFSPPQTQTTPPLRRSPGD